MLTKKIRVLGSSYRVLQQGLAICSAGWSQTHHVALDDLQT